MHDVRRFSLVFAAVGLVAFNVSAPAAAQSDEGRAVRTAATSETIPSKTGGELSGTFWEVLGDTTLNRLMDEARRGNLDLRAAAARVDAADASHFQAALELTPSISASGGYTRRRLASSAFPGVGAGTLPDQDLWDSGLNAAWELDLFGRLRSGLRARSELLGAADEDVRDVQVSIGAELARSYFDLRGTQDRLAVARRNAENQRHTLELTQNRLEAGRGTELDTERARAQLSSTLAAIPSLEARIATMQYRIAVLVGRAPAELAGELTGQGGLPELPDTVPASSPSELVRRRPDVLGAESRVAATEALVSSARADYLPRLSLAATAGYTANAVDAFGNRGTFNYAFGPVITWAAFDMGRVKSRVDQAQARQREARAQFEQLTLLAREDIEATTVLYRTARARLEHLRQAAAASERAAALARLRYEGGIADFLQVLDAERTVLAAQDQLAQGETQAADAYVGLYEARGATWPAERSGGNR